MAEHIGGGDVLTDTVFRGDITIGDESTDTLTVGAATTITGSLTVSGAQTLTGAQQISNTLTVGVDDTGYDVIFYGATAGQKLFWDESADTLNLDCTVQIDGTVTVGVDDTGYDVKLFGATAGSYLLWDESADELVLNAATLQLGGKVKFALNGGAASASGLLMGVGTSGSPATTAVAGSIFAEFRTQSTATSGDSRGLYWRHDINGAAGGGECIRAFSKVTAAASTVRGAHISLDLDAAGTVSGFGAAVDAQLMLGAAAYADDITALNLNIYGNASATVTGRTSFLRPVINGDGTAVADINANAFFIDFSNVTASSAGLIDTDITALTGYGSLKVRCPDGVTRYIPITTGS